MEKKNATPRWSTYIMVCRLYLDENQMFIDNCVMLRIASFPVYQDSSYVLVTERDAYPQYMPKQAITTIIERRLMNENQSAVSDRCRPKACLAVIRY